MCVYFIFGVCVLGGRIHACTHIGPACACVCVCARVRVKEIHRFKDNQMSRLSKTTFSRFSFMKMSENYQQNLRFCVHEVRIHVCMYVCIYMHTYIYIISNT